MRSRGMRSREIRCVSRERDDILAKYCAIFTLELHRQNPIYSRTDAFTLSGFTTASCKAALNDRNSTGHRVAYIIMTGLMHLHETGLKKEKLFAFISIDYHYPVILFLTLLLFSLFPSFFLGIIIYFL